MGNAERNGDKTRVKRFLKTKGAFVLILCAIIVLITGLSAALAGGRVGFVQNGVQALGRPVGAGISAIVTNFERLYDQMHRYDTLEARYEALRDRIAEYERIAREAEEIREENERLRLLLEMPALQDDLYYIDANILSWDPSNWTSAFTIDRGVEFGIQRGDPVMTERRELIGIVHNVGRGFATVHTIIDPGFSAGGQMGTGITAVAEGNFALMQDGRLRLSHVPSEVVPLLNDTITTSGLGGRIPPGLVLGHVERVGFEGTGANHYGIIEPAVSFSRLVQVFVIQQNPFAYVEVPDIDETEEP